MSHFGGRRVSILVELTLNIIIIITAIFDMALIEQ